MAANQALIDTLRRQLDGPRDGALLRFALGGALLDAGDATGAAAALRAALDFDPAYSAAWKLLGKALTAAGDTDGAIAAYRQGIAAAEQRGDKQAQKEMQVFLRRLQKPA
jgi:Tfp pilus assembly protein PilF